MAVKLRIAIMTCLILIASVFALEAYRSINPKGTAVPEEVYAQFQRSGKEAKYYLKGWEGRVAVYSGKREKEPMRVTAIELSELRNADKAMLQRGIPVVDTRELLGLLEDLGS